MGLEPISVHVSWCTYRVCFNSAFPIHVLSEPVESKRIPIVRSMAAVVLVPKAGLEPAKPWFLAR